ncbi:MULTISPECIES: DNA-binding protein [Metallosphaera]|uniref:DNA-binding protein Msed_1625 n=3 Tax=Metallosphaera TaxID=41980 RepID=A4YH78_METS5|nr:MULTISPECIES: DNA-binding protein [Metallosphaera]ABP95780.1 DNA-binding TFAR19-related protein [Metallosphaera sedula DSM 5348]AIM27764.1 DNA-binding TFAR19-related protein [Metallosphaera sedula]AKV74620.1 DNA-binding protein [Metallosphaera sedula]AKV76858.1 DNA-binding protein [Metallosphaera sedula]AKV79109.1 DNA-binding protein [Metallosphaera sedula]
MSQDDYSDPELEELLRRRAQTESRRAAEERQRKAELEARKDALLRSILTPEARQRLSNVKLVKPELAESLEDQLIALAQSGRIRVPVTDEELKEILSQIAGQSKRDFKIQIRERGWK